MPLKEAFAKLNPFKKDKSTEDMGCASSKEPAPAQQASPNKNASPAKPSAVAAPTAPAPAAVSTEREKPRIRTDNVKDHYKLGRTLGTGGFASVKEATHRATGEKFACKIMNLPKEGAVVSPDEFTREDIFKEIEILTRVNHPNVMYMKECFIAEDKVYLMCEYLDGGELLEAVLQNERYSEADARQAFIQLLEGLKYIHSMGIVHRDLKLENLLLAKKDDITSMKIADFGLAKHLGAGRQTGTVCGTPAYVSAEVISGGPGHKYGPKVDLWSAGVVLYILLAGYPPFHDQSEPKMFQKIREGKYNFDDPVWNAVSAEAKDLIRKLIVIDPNQRLTAEEALHHPWITGVTCKKGQLNIDRGRTRKLLNDFDPDRRKF